MKRQSAAVETFRRNVSRETLGLLDIYADLLRRWNARINLVSPRTIDEMWSRHILDSAQLVDHVSGSGKRWADLGSGGGFPGLVIAILLRDKDEFSMTLVESDQRKCTFLRTVARECGLSVTVLPKRIEEVRPLGVDAISARALAPLAELLSFAETHLVDGGIAVFPKGARADIEVAEARKKWSFTHETFPSKTDGDASILKIGDIKRV